MKKSLLLAGIALLGAPCFVAPVRAQTTVADSSEAAALALMDKAAAAYAALDGLSMKYTDFAAVSGLAVRGMIEFSKTGGIRLTSSEGSGNVWVKEDPGRGNRQNRQVLAVELERRMPSNAGVPLAALMQGKNPLRVGLFGAPDGVWKNIRLLPDNGVAATAGVGAINIDVAFYFDSTDYLLRRFETRGQVQGKKFLLLTTFSSIEPNPTFAADTFVVPPQPVQAPRDPDVYWDPKIKVGAAPYDLQGVNLAKFKDKVLLLDFWATWCGPCVQEVPTMLKSYGKYHPKGFEIVGISLDESRTDLDGFVKARKLPWAQVYDGKGWKGANVAKYGVKGIPFTLLVGKDGKIAAINPRGEALEPAIKLALAK